MNALDALAAAAVNIDEARRFLELLGGTDARWTFQTFDDDGARREKRAADAKAAGEVEHARMIALGHAEKVAKSAATKAITKAGKDPFARIFHGTLDEHERQLARLNADRVGVFVTVNETDLEGRRAENVVRVRAIFADLDGVELEETKAKLAEVGLKPHVVVQSSPGRWHVYMLVSDFPLARFNDTQQRVIKLLGSDPAVNDLPRVMRLPGFDHHKREPFGVLMSENEDHQPYGPEAFDLLPPIEEPKRERGRSSSTDDPITDAVERLGLVLGDGVDGGLNITCLWEHSPGTPSSTTYWPPVGGKPPGFKCQHATCIGRTIKQFIDELRRRDGTLDQHFKSQKKPPPPEPPEDPRPEPKGRFVGKRWAEITFDPDGGEWLVQGLLPLVGMMVFYGRKKVFKSFVVLSLGAAIAGRREQWAGCTIKRYGAVVYIAGEGGAGVRKRIAGLKQTYADLDAKLPFILIEARPNLGVAHGDVDELLAAIRAMLVESDGPPVLVIIDTLVRTLHGTDENGDGMRNFADNAEQVAEHLGCLVVAVHHQGGGDGMRGHTSLPGASVASWRIEPLTNGQRYACRITVEDAKDGESGFALVATLRQHYFGDPEHDPECASTLVVESIEPADPAETTTAKTGRTKRGPSKQQRLFMDAMRQALHDHGEDGTQTPNSGPRVRAVDGERVRKRYYTMLGNDVTPASKATLFARRRNAAVDAREIIVGDVGPRTMFWLPEREP
jgi:hypothetical protein